VTIRYAYTHSVLRYVHDITAGEFVNVGVALCAPEARYVGALCRTTYGRLARLFPGMDGQSFRATMCYIQSQFKLLGAELANKPQPRSFGTVIDLAHMVLPSDDSGLQWAPIGGGLTRDPSRELKKLYERMVMQYEIPRRGAQHGQRAAL